jgi:hypothetical protein
MITSRRVLAIVILTLTVTLTACSKDASPSAGTADGGGSAGGVSGGGAEGFEGSVATSGPYAATWTASPEAKADVFNSYNPVTVVSDHQTFGNVSVKPDGSVSFGSTASELSPNLVFNGAQAQVTLDHTGQFVCAFTVDTDLTGTRDGAKLHMKGAMKVHWHPQGVGDLNCP